MHCGVAQLDWRCVVFQTNRLMKQMQPLHPHNPGETVNINQCTVCVLTGLLSVDANDLGCTRTPLTVYTDMIPHLEMH